MLCFRDKFVLNFVLRGHLLVVAGYKTVVIVIVINTAVVVAAGVVLKRYGLLTLITLRSDTAIDHLVAGSND